MAGNGMIGLELLEERRRSSTLSSSRRRRRTDDGDCERAEGEATHARVVNGEPETAAPLAAAMRGRRSGSRSITYRRSSTVPAAWRCCRRCGPARPGARRPGGRRPDSPRSRRRCVCWPTRVGSSQRVPVRSRSRSRCDGTTAAFASSAGGNIDLDVYASMIAARLRRRASAAPPWRRRRRCPPRARFRSLLRLRIDASLVYDVARADFLRHAHLAGSSSMAVDRGMAVGSAALVCALAIDSGGYLPHTWVWSSVLDLLGCSPGLRPRAADPRGPRGRDVRRKHRTAHGLDTAVGDLVDRAGAERPRCPSRLGIRRRRARRRRDGTPGARGRDWAGRPRRRGHRRPRRHRALPGQRAGRPRPGCVAVVARRLRERVRGTVRHRASDRARARSARRAPSRASCRGRVGSAARRGHRPRLEPGRRPRSRRRGCRARGPRPASACTRRHGRAQCRAGARGAMPCARGRISASTRRTRRAAEQSRFRSRPLLR